MSNQSIKDLSSKEIIDIELENLSLLFLLGFSHQDQPCSVLWFINYCRKGVDENEDYKVCQALSEAFQWLCNEGLIAKIYTKRNHVHRLLHYQKGAEEVGGYIMNKL